MRVSEVPMIINTMLIAQSRCAWVIMILEIFSQSLFLGLRELVSDLREGGLPPIATVCGGLSNAADLI